MNWCTFPVRLFRAASYKPEGSSWQNLRDPGLDQSSSEKINALSDCCLFFLHKFVFHVTKKTQ